MTLIITLLLIVSLVLQVATMITNYRRTSQRSFPVADESDVVPAPNSFWVGDKLQIVANEYSHDFPIGSIVTLIQIDSQDRNMPYFCEDESGRCSWVSRLDVVATPSYPESTLKTSKYHVGDEVVVVANTTCHEFPIGTKVTITDINGLTCECECADGEDWYLDESEITPVALYDEPTPITDWLSEHGDPAITAAVEAEAAAMEAIRTAPRYRTGDTVRVIGDSLIHGYPLNTHVQIEHVMKNGYVCSHHPHGTWIVGEDDVAAVDTNPPTRPVPTYEVGDQAKVIDRKYGHGFQIGDYVDVLEYTPGGYNCRLTGHMDGAIWWMADIELAPVSTQTPHTPSASIFDQAITSRSTPSGVPSDSFRVRTPWDRQYNLTSPATSETIDNVRAIQTAIAESADIREVPAPRPVRLKRLLILAALAITIMGSCNCPEVTIQGQVVGHEAVYDPNEPSRIKYHTILRCDDGRVRDMEGISWYATQIGGSYTFTETQCR
jgi:hypothetical protein